MFCSNPKEKGTEKDLLRNLAQASATNPSRCKSVFKSLVRDLSFWDIDEYQIRFEIDGQKEKSFFFSTKGKIPTLNELVDMNTEDRCILGEGSDDNSEYSPSSKAVWKNAVDPESGKTYYYDIISKKTQWRKPSILKEMEREKKKERRRVAREFFDEMEKNILNSLSRGEVIPGIPRTETKKQGPPKEPFPKSKHVRTISAMHGVLLEELGEDLKIGGDDHCVYEPNIRKPIGQKSVGRPPLAGSRGHKRRSSSNSSNKTQQNAMNFGAKSCSKETMARIKHQPAQAAHSNLVGENSLPTQVDERSHESRQNPSVLSTRSSMGHTRRNTEGTVHFKSTMTNPDVNATIKCVCGVFRAHIRQSIEDKRWKEKKNAKKILEYDVFDDEYVCSEKLLRHPSLADISDFYKVFYQRSQMEHDAIIFSLIYVERLIKCTNGILTPSPQNWRSLLFSCMVLASKVWDDLSMWNYDFANVTADTTGLTSFTLSRINELELALLKCLKFNVRIPASEYAKYYFLIRTTLLQSGLVKEDQKSFVARDASQKSEILNTTNSCIKKQQKDRRSNSMDGNILRYIFHNT